MFKGIVTSILGRLPWLAYWKVLLLVSLISYSSGLYSMRVLWNLSNQREELALQEQKNKMINDANDVSKNREKKREGNNTSRRKFAERNQNAENPGYSSVVDTDGMQFINDALATVHSSESDK